VHSSRMRAGDIAAEREAARKRMLADAEACEITQIDNAIARNQAYIQLQSLEVLKAIIQGSGKQSVFPGRFEPESAAVDALGRHKAIASKSNQDR